MEIYPVDNSIISKIPYLRGIYRIVKWHRVVSRLEFDVIYMPFCWSGNSLKVKGKRLLRYMIYVRCELQKDFLVIHGGLKS